MDGTSPTIKRSRTGMSPDTGMSAAAGVPHIVLRDITKLAYVVSEYNTLWYRNAYRFINIKPCDVKVVDVLKDHKFVPNDCFISKCGTKNCKNGIFSLPTILFQVISPKVHFPHIVSRICLVNLIT